VLFNSLAYLIFLPIVVTLFWVCPKRCRTIILLLASYVFYMSWKPIYGLLIVGLTALNYVFGLLIASNEKRKKLLLTLAVASNLLLLAYFKYTYFLIDTANQCLASFAQKIPNPSFEIILPLGISFFVFEFIHYVVDVYKGGKPVKSPIDFALFASFFPTQIAGPIKRYQDFIPQLSDHGSFKLKYFDEGLWLIIFGLFKKVIFADNLAAVVNSGFARPDLLTGFDLWLVVYAFAFEIYFDFSGYTDIARGSALLFGYKVPPNFNLPYLASSIAEFWHRWHISLSTWLRDYLYIPLGGSRCSKWFNYRNLFLTMALGGLWHGASMHFLIWGAYQGIMLILHKEFTLLAEKIGALNKLRQTKFFKLASILLTFHVVCIGWVFFRASNMAECSAIMQRLFFLEPSMSFSQLASLTIVNIQDPIIYMLLPIVLALLAGGQILSGWIESKKDSGGLSIPMPLRAAAIAVLIGLLIIFTPDTSPKFIYFQF
jgi:D-alanyl-lipoteichoic acid acyltransferase DltB (MBOAT superfamily)